MKKIFVVILSLLISISAYSKKIKSSSDSKLILKKADAAQQKKRNHQSHCSHASHYSALDSSESSNFKKNKFINSPEEKALVSGSHYREGYSALQNRMVNLLKEEFASKNIYINNITIDNDRNSNIIESLTDSITSAAKADLVIEYKVNDSIYTYVLVDSKWFVSVNKDYAYSELSDKEVIDILSKVASIFINEERRIYQESELIRKYYHHSEN